MTGLPFEHRPGVGRRRLELPGGNRVAVWVGLNIEYYPPGKPQVSIVPMTAGLDVDPANYGWRDYGVRVGIWRVAGVLDRVGMRASAIINSDVCEHYPEIIEGGRARDWAWLAHGKDNATLQAGMAPEEERRYLAEVIETIERHTGARPKGWLGPALTETVETPRLLAELGLTYLCDWCNDDEPYPLRRELGRMIAMPYTLEVNDIPLLMTAGASAADFERALVDQFDVLYEEGARSGRVMAIPLHPFLVGQPFRIRHLERALECIASRPGVWMATSDEIADWYFERYYDA